MKATRLGQLNESRVQLLKVEVRNILLKRSILSNVKKLHNARSKRLRKIYITPDLSYQERMHQKNLCSELQRHSDTGESDLVICRGQIVTASMVAADMDYSPSFNCYLIVLAHLLSHLVMIRVGNTYSYFPFVKEPLFVNNLQVTRHPKTYRFCTLTMIS